MRTLFLRRLSPFGVIAAIVLVVPCHAQGQSFLERLEARLGRAADADPPADESAPAEPPPAATELSEPQVGRPGYLGIVGDDAPQAAGVVVAAVRGNSPAARAGFQKGDVVVAIDGTPIKSVDEMGRRLERRWVGSEVEFRVLRGEAEQAIRLTLGDRPRAAAALPPPEPAPPPGPQLQAARQPEAAAPAVLGARLEPVNAELARRYGFATRQGAVITGITPETAAERYRLPIGGVIVSINGQEVRSVEDVSELLSAAAPGDEWEIAYMVRQQRQRTRVRLSPGGGALPVPVVNDRPQAPAPAATPGLGLGNRLDAGGRRPLLGRIGRVLDGVLAETAPPVGLPPNDEPPFDDPEMRFEQQPGGEEGPVNGDELSLLREEIRLLREEVDLLRRRVQQLER